LASVRRCGFTLFPTVMSAACGPTVFRPNKGCYEKRIASIYTLLTALYCSALLNETADAYELADRATGSLHRRQTARRSTHYN